MANVEFKPVTVGDMSDIPPDAPPGEWVATCSVTKGATKKDNYPMLILNWKLDEAVTDGNENFQGSRVADFLFFPDRNARSFKMQVQKLRSLCQALKLDTPAITRIESWDDLAEFISELDGAKARIFTTVQADRQSGEQRTQVQYTPPRGMSSDPTGSTVEAEAPAKPKLKLKKKVQ